MSVATLPTTLPETGLLSEAARLRFEHDEGAPLLVAHWIGVVMLCYEADAAALRALMPFDSDTRGGHAYVVALTQTVQRLRLTAGGRVVDQGRVLSDFYPSLTLLTPVRDGDEPGWFPLMHWCPPPAPGTPRLRFGVPWRPAEVTLPLDTARVGVQADGGTLDLNFDPSPARTRFSGSRPSASTGSFDEFLWERYALFTAERTIRRRVRFWHEPWAVAPIDVRFEDDSLLRRLLPWMGDGRFIGAARSPGAHNAWIGRPQCINGPACARPWPM